MLQTIKLMLILAVYALNFEKVGDKLVSACPYVCVCVCVCVRVRVRVRVCVWGIEISS